MEEFFMHECHFSVFMCLLFVAEMVLLEFSHFIYSLVIDRSCKRKTYIGKMSIEEYHILQDLIISKNGQLKDVNYEELGKQLYLFVSSQYVKEKSRSHKRKIFIDKVKFFRGTK